MPDTYPHLDTQTPHEHNTQNIDAKERVSQGNPVPRFGVRTKKKYMLVAIGVLTIMYTVSAVFFHSMSWSLSGPGVIRLDKARYLKRWEFGQTPYRHMCYLGSAYKLAKIYASPPHLPGQLTAQENSCSFPTPPPFIFVIWQIWQPDTYEYILDSSSSQPITGQLVKTR